MWYSFLFCLASMFAPLPIQPKIRVITPTIFTFQCSGYTSLFEIGKEFYRHTPAAQYIRRTSFTTSLRKMSSSEN